jgi:hypothetical protein
VKKALSLTLIINLIIFLSYVFFEPQLTKAVADETGISLSVTGEININCSTTAALSPAIAGQSGGIATTTFGCNVETNDDSGYNLKLKKDQLIQTAGGGADKQFDDYTTSTNPIDFTWGAVSAGAEEFGFCVNSGADTTQRYQDSGAACNTGSNVTAWRCWDYITTNPTEREVANRASATSGGGSYTEFGLRAEAGGSNNLQEGTYNCTTTATALVNS